MKGTRSMASVLRAACVSTLMVVLGAGAFASSSREVPQPYVSVVSEDAAGVTLSVRIPLSAVSEQQAADGLRRISIRGLGHVPTPGFPELPMIVTTLGVPDGAAVMVSATPGPIRVSPGLPVRTVRERLEDDESIASKAGRPGDLGAGPWPEQVVRHQVMQFRELRLVRLEICPVRYRQANHEVVYHESIEIRVDFAGGEGFRRVAGRMGATAERLVDRHVVNRETVRAGWKATETITGRGANVRVPAPAPKTAVGTNPGIKIRVDEAGLIRVPRAELVAAGFDPTTVDPRYLEMSYRGTPIPCRIVGEADGALDPGDAIEFYGVPANSRFAAENVYWLEESPALGLRFPTRGGAPAGAALVSEFPHTAHFEPENEVYTVGKPAEEGDPHFYWAWFENSTAPPRVTTLTHWTELPGLGTGPDAKFRAFFRGRTDTADDPDHKIRMRVNGNILGESTWDGMAFHTAEIPFDAGLLVGGMNGFRVEWRFVTVPDIYYMDWIEIEYPHTTQAEDDVLTITSQGGDERFQVTGFTAAADPLVLDVTDPHAPVRLTDPEITGVGPYTIEFENDGASGDQLFVAGDAGHRSAASIELDVPTSLKSASNGADLLIVVPSGWEDELAPLVTRRQSQGLRVVLATLTDVADEFAGGNVDDVAIKDFVAHAYGTYQAPAPSMLLLVGEPSLDPRNWIGRDPFYHLMPTHFSVTEAQGETISDTWFGAVAGADELPDLAVARFSVRTEDDASDLVAKTLGYDDNPPDGAPWGSRVLQIASSDVSFEDAQESSAALLPDEYQVVEEYRRDGADAASITDALEDGALVTSFVGHGNVNVWADVPGGVFWRGSDVVSVSNHNRLTMVTAMNCLNGLIADPYNPDSLAESFHNRPATGAIAMWAPSALGFLRQYDELQQVFYETLFVDRVPELGFATNSSLVETYLTRPSTIDLVREMILLGDPSGWIAIDCSSVDVVCDGSDDDCDGQIDEEFTSQTSTCGVGACVSSGTTSCADGVFADTCVPGAPAPDDADCNNIDDDCNGLTDDGFPVEPTFCGIGACSATGMTRCIEGAIDDTCTPGDPAPSDPTCDGSDDDCDGIDDEDYVPVATACGLGICQSAGITSCETGSVADSCVPGVAEPTDATCDGIDQNCDGVADDEFPNETTSCGIGACFREGQTICTGAMIKDTCTPGQAAPSDFTCDGIDDDCDGVADEDFVPQATVCGLGPCASAGVTSCVGGVIQDSCTPGEAAPDDATCNDFDDDCDGVVDDDFLSTPTSCGIGDCRRDGETQCVDGNFINTCVPGLPHAELCDGIDNDCDGNTDEEDAINPSNWYPDNDGDGYGTDAGQVSACDPPEGWVAEPTDCDDGNPQAWATPGEVTELRFGPDPSTIGWDPPIEPGGEIDTYLVRSSAPGGFATAVCVDPDSATTANDATVPPSGEVFYYLARAENGCPSGVGTLGHDSGQVERSGRTCPLP